MDEQMKCPTCKANLRWDKPRECWNCDNCHPVGEPKPKFDVGAIPEVIFQKKQEDEIRRIVREELEKFGNETTIIEEKTDWRGDAKRLGIPLYDHEAGKLRKKVDVLKEIEEKSIVDDSDQSPVE